MKELNFSKMQSLGNDFIVIDAINQSVDLTPIQMRSLANRHLGIGCDQILLAESSRSEAADFHFTIFNADGSEARQCGNGARCFAKFLRDKGLSDKQDIVVDTVSGRLALHCRGDGSVAVNMGHPRFSPRDIPFEADTRAKQYRLQLGADSAMIAALSMGNPHAVLRVTDTAAAPVDSMGEAISHHERFPDRANVGFMEVSAPNKIKLRVYERGVGETRACGSGACAAMVAGRIWGLLAESVTVELPGGSMQVHWQGETADVTLTGPAHSVFEGQLDLENL